MDDGIDVEKTCTVFNVVLVQVRAFVLNVLTNDLWWIELIVVVKEHLDDIKLIIIGRLCLRVLAFGFAAGLLLHIDTAHEIGEDLH